MTVCWEIRWPSPEGDRLPTPPAGVPVCRGGRRRRADLQAIIFTVNAGISFDSADQLTTCGAAAMFLVEVEAKLTARPSGRPAEHPCICATLPYLLHLTR
jgi:hypothetical protein